VQHQHQPADGEAVEFGAADYSRPSWPGLPRPPSPPLVLGGGWRGATPPTISLLAQVERLVGWPVRPAMTAEGMAKEGLDVALLLTRPAVIMLPRTTPARPSWPGLTRPPSPPHPPTPAQTLIPLAFPRSILARSACRSEVANEQLVRGGRVGRESFRSGRESES